MLKVKQLTNKQDIHHFLYNTKLRQTLYDEDMQALARGVEWEMNPSCKYLGAYKKKKLIGILRYEMVNAVTIFAHPSIHPSYWGTNMSVKCCKVFDAWFSENTLYHKMITPIPAPCEEALRATRKHDYIMEGRLKGGCYWRNKIEDLILMTRFIQINRSE